MTQKLYDEDSHLARFSAHILFCAAEKNGFDVTLDQTAFYPEGGGQPCDFGALGGANVTDVQDREGVIVHTCDAPLAVGATVLGEIDWARRFDLMQQHAGEHIVSGLIHRLYGHDNVGFHMGADMITIDLSGELTGEQLLQVEQLANAAIWENSAVLTHYPTADALQALRYRSKKSLTGQVRLIEYPGIDLCACCGTHVRQTGEIGVIRLFSCTKFRSGVRIELLCGQRCLSYLRGIWEQNRQISGLLSAKPLQTAAAAQRVLGELADAKIRVTQLEAQLFAQQAAALRGAGDVLLREEGLSPDALRRLAVAVSEVCGGRAAAFSGQDDAGYQYAISHEGGDLHGLCKALNTALDGRGGGKPNLIQGSVRAHWTQIAAFMQQL